MKTHKWAQIAVVVVSGFCPLPSAFSQRVLTADGLAAFGTNAATGGGGGGGGDITSNLAHWWKFDEGTGTTAADSAGSDTATLHGTTAWTAGMIGANAIAYPSATGSGCSLASSVTTGTTFTYAAWIYWKGAAATYQNLFSQGGSSGFWINSSKIDWVFSGLDHRSNTVITANTWHHIAVVCNSSAVTFYLDGVPDGTTSSAVSFTADGMGADGGNSGEAFNGNHDDVRFYTRALSATDISTLYSFR